MLFKTMFLNVMLLRWICIQRTLRKLKILTVYVYNTHYWAIVYSCNVTCNADKMIKHKYFVSIFYILRPYQFYIQISVLSRYGDYLH